MAELDVQVSETSFGWHWAVWTSLVLAVLDLTVAALLLGMDIRIADEYVAAVHDQAREIIRGKHENLRKYVIGTVVGAFILAGLYGSAALYGMTLQSFWAVSVLFLPLLVSLPFIHFFLLFRRII